MAAGVNPGQGVSKSSVNGISEENSVEMTVSQLNSTEDGCRWPEARTQVTLKHDPGISVDWTNEEQCILEDLIVKYASESLVVQYAKIATQLQDKTVRDVALRFRWMSKKEISKRRKEEYTIGKKSKERKDNVVDASGKTSSPLSSSDRGLTVPTLATGENDDDLLEMDDVGGIAGQLLLENASKFNQISANFSSFHIRENIVLFSQAQNNISKLLNKLSETAEAMLQMPPFPVKVNEDLANSVVTCMEE